VIHVFVESNWVVDVCAPAFLRTKSALALLDAASRNEIVLHVPSIALREARSVIQRKYQPNEASKLQAFRRWATDNGLQQQVSRCANEFLTRYSNTVMAELSHVHSRIDEVAGAAESMYSPSTIACFKGRSNSATRCASPN
jgi:hypothetical protein